MRASCFFTVLVGAVGCAEPTPIATGELGPWEAATPMPTPRANHCSAAIGDWLLVIGGNHADAGGFVKTDEIHAAHLTDGVLGPWHVAGRAPSAVTECAATSDGASLYLVGGIYDDAADQGQVWTATLDDAGMLGELRALTTMPTDAVTSMEAAVRDATLLVTDTHTPAAGDKTRTLALTLGGTSWTERDWNIGFRAQAQIAFTDEHVYTIGGYNDPALGTVSDVAVQSIADGTTRATTPLPVATGFGEAVAVDGWLFVVGGRGQVFGAPGTQAVYAGELAADGSVVAWTERGGLPTARTNHEVALVGDYLVLTGGAEMGPGDDAVMVARVRWPAAE